jgi:hypothetical protein
MPLVFRPGPAEVAFIVLLVTWAVFETVMRGLQAFRATGPDTRDPSQLVLLPALLAAVVAAQVLGRRGGLLWPGGLVWPVVAGLALMVAGIAPGRSPPWAASSSTGSRSSLVTRW